ncbi:CdaR family transcriptional regulator [Anaerorhabdus sp.]|uniref:CdaR family transcriptional regulator n=1 Tax=Anaerorhabdus sp. TaxID=1872524 RepID=UPI002FCAA197
MMIELINAQKIVDRLISILGKNINIMNTDGVIIASGEPKRLSMIHMGAKQAVEHNQEVVINQQNIHDFPGCKEGINIPIKLYDQIIGVVGITGEIDEARLIAITIKELVELMMNEQLANREALLSKEASEAFLRNSIEGRIKVDAPAQYNLLYLLKVDVEQFTSFAFQNLRQDIVSFMLEKKSVALYLNSSIFVIFSNYDIVEDMHRVITENHHLQFTLIKSISCTNVTDYYDSYAVAKEVMKTVSTHQYFDVKDLSLDFILSYIQPHNVHLLLKTTGINFKNEKQFNKMVELAQAMIQENMNMNKVAQRLFLHRNTIIKRLEKIQIVTGLDLCDCMTCLKIIIISKLLGKTNKVSSYSTL